MALLLSPDVPSISAGRRCFETPARVIPSRTAVCRLGKRVVAGSGIRVGLKDGVKHLEDAAEVLNLGENVCLNLNSGQLFSVPVKQQPSTASSLSKPSKEEEEKRNYYLNTGYAIRTLREEFPALFYKEPSFDIYRDDITFKDPLNTFVGIENYKSIFWGLRFHGRIFFKALWIDIISVWQPVDNMIMVRWTAHGVPRVPWESHGRFDGTSEYKLDKNGKIYEHQVHNIVPPRAPPKFHVLSVEDLIRSIGCPSTPRPTYFKTSSSSLREFVQQTNFEGIEHYVSSLLASVPQSDKE
ncbi:OLC1v1000246C1 [Oldenlandia corymbosa var. corymbosa]|uniref:OLC1v1000246C1 n=1 Tax=Oldenlandia corymbosa var. corymbosa TaxID=529605 RepID=A0AAV1D385_OLDCO|nr:OLC1v1000246C1 [Oldenlandia corymbosa var. corymbosa]